MEIFRKENLKDLVFPKSNSHKGQNGQVTIIGGSSLFHGAPLLSLTTASRFVDMVYFGSPEKSVGKVANSIKSKLFSFIWVPWEEIDEYIEKSDAILIGPGLMRCKSGVSRLTNDRLDEEGIKTQKIVRKFLTKFPEKKWVIDAGGLQMLKKEWIPKGAILTPNRKEYLDLFGDINPSEAARKYDCVIVYKLPTTIVASPDYCFEIKGGNAGLTKGGTGDVQAGLAVGLLAKNPPILAGAAASFLVKEAANKLFKKVGTVYNADDLAKEIPLFFPQLMR